MKPKSVTETAEPMIYVVQLRHYVDMRITSDLEWGEGEPWQVWGFVGGGEGGYGWGGE